MKIFGRTILTVLALLCLGQAVQAKRFSVSTNIADYASLGTLNAEASYAFARKWSVDIGGKYNPWTFRKNQGPSKQFQMRHQTWNAGVRFWPWHTYSGWWISGKLQYQEYNIGGIRSRKTEEGDKAGAGLSAGYTLMIHPRLNLEFGLGVWGGMKWYTQYTCPLCGVTCGGGRKGFFSLNDIIISLSYVF